MGYDYKTSSWDALTYKSASGGYKLKASAARNGATLQDAYNAYGAPTGKLAGQITGYNPNLIKTDTKLATGLGMAPDTRGVTGTGAVQPTNLGVMAAASPSYAPVKPAAPPPAAPPTTTPATYKEGAIRPAAGGGAETLQNGKWVSLGAMGGTKTLQSVTDMAKPGVAPASPAAAGLPSTTTNPYAGASFSIEVQPELGVMAEPASYFGSGNSYADQNKGTSPTGGATYGIGGLTGESFDAFQSGGAGTPVPSTAPPVIGERRPNPYGGEDVVWSGGGWEPASQFKPIVNFLNPAEPLPTTGTYQPAMATPITTAQKPLGSTFVDPTTGKTLYSDGQGRWLTGPEYTRMLATNGDPMAVTGSQAAAGGGVVQPGQNYGGPVTNKVISEGGANISSGGQIPAATDDGSTYAAGSQPYPGSNPTQPTTGQQPGGTTTPGGAGQPAGGQAGTPLVVNPDPTGQGPGSTPTQQGGGATIAATDAQKAAVAAALAGPQLGVMASAAVPAFVDPYAAQSNPYDEAYQRRLAGQAVDNAEQQYGIMARRMREDAADRGFGTNSGFYLGAMNELARDTAAARTRGLNEAMLTTADHRANYGQQWNQGKLASQRDQFDRWKVTELMPYEKQQAVAQVENLVQIGRLNAVQAEAAKQVLDNQGWLAFIEFVAKLAPAAGLVLGAMA